MNLLWDDAKFLAFDFETSGELPEYALQPWRVSQGKAWATSLAVVRKLGPKPRVTGGLNPDAQMMRDMLEEAIAEDLTVVGWNVTFDIEWLIAYGLWDLVKQVRWLDGMRLWRHFDLEPEYDTERHKKKSYGLKRCVAENYPEHAGYEEDVDFHDPSPEARAKLHKYNIKDTAHTFRLTKKYFQALVASNPRRLRTALIEAKCFPHVAKANVDGMVVDPLAVAEVQAWQTRVAREKLELLAPLGVNEVVVRSPAKLSAVMFNEWGLKPLKINTSAKTGKTSFSTDKEVLYELGLFDPRAAMVSEYRAALNNKTKFPDAIAKSVAYNEDGRTHPQAIVFSTYTGRITIASKQGKNKDERQIGYAKHQMKRDKRFRGMVTVPPPDERAPEGYVLMEFDAAGQEFRWMAVASGDETMLQLCLPGEDPHSYMGSRIAHCDYHELIKRVHAEEKEAETIRKSGKVGNLSLQYRTSAKRFLVTARVDYGIPMLLPEAVKIHGTYQRTYKRVPIYWQNQISKVKRLGFVETLAGRRVQVIGNWNGKNGWSMESTSINYPIQGTGGDQKYLALAVLNPYLVKHDIVFAWDLHDGLYFYVPKRIKDKAAVEIKRILDNLPYKQAWGLDVPIPIPLPWDCKVGTHWGNLKEYKPQ